MDSSPDDDKAGAAMWTLWRWFSARLRPGARSAPDPERLASWQDPSLRLPRKFPLRCWLFALSLFIACYGFMWSYVHVRVDTNPCLTRLVDPLFPLIAQDGRWRFVTHDLYELLTISMTAALVWQAWRGDQRPLLRWGTALALQAALRSITILLLPVCRASVEPGSIALSEVPVLDLGFVEIPWRVWATNDLIFSGHVGEFLLFYWATRGFPRWTRVGLVVFQILQAYGLIATRGHYTIDLVLAVPCAFFADSMAVELLDRIARFKRGVNIPPRATPAEARLVEPAGIVHSVNGVR